MFVPFLFITSVWACSGFHCQWSSSGTRAAIAERLDAQLVGYGSMLAKDARRARDFGVLRQVSGWGDCERTTSDNAKR